MKLNGSEIVGAPIDLTWRGLNDPELLKNCIPGCDYFIRESPSLLHAQVTIKFSLIKFSVAGRIEQRDLSPPRSCRLLVEGEGAFASQVRAEARINLVDLAMNQTRVDFELEGMVGGRLAALGSRLISSTAQSHIHRFFQRFENALHQRY